MEPYGNRVAKLEEYSGLDWTGLSATRPPL